MFQISHWFGQTKEMYFFLIDDDVTLWRATKWRHTNASCLKKQVSSVETSGFQNLRFPLWGWISFRRNQLFRWDRELRRHSANLLPFPPSRSSSSSSDRWSLSPSSWTAPCSAIPWRGRRWRHGRGQWRTSAFLQTCRRRQWRLRYAQHCNTTSYHCVILFWKILKKTWYETSPKLKKKLLGF